MADETWNVESEADMRQLGAELVRRFRASDVVLLTGELGAGKTTLVRGALHGLGWAGEVRSPTFNLIQVYDTRPPVMHADLYRVKSWQGIGIEDYLDTHVCFVEWPDRLSGLIPAEECWRIAIEFEGSGRSVRLTPPG